MKTWFLAFAVLILAAACIADARARWHVTPLYVVALPPVPPDCNGLRYVFVVTGRTVNVAIRGHKGMVTASAEGAATSKEMSPLAGFPAFVFVLEEKVLFLQGCGRHGA